MSARAILALIIVALMAAIGFGAAWQQSRIDAAKAETLATEEKLSAAQAERDTALQERDDARQATRIVTQYVDRVEIVRVAGQTITREIPVYVTEKADSACTVPVGFVRIHNAAAENEIPGDPAGDIDAPAPGVTLSSVADTVTFNYTQYHALAQQLIAAHEYIRASCYTP